MFWSNRVQESERQRMLGRGDKSLSSKPVPSLAAHFFFSFSQKITLEIF